MQFKALGNREPIVIRQYCYPIHQAETKESFYRRLDEQFKKKIFGYVERLGCKPICVILDQDTENLLKGSNSYHVGYYLGLFMFGQGPNTDEDYCVVTAVGRNRPGTNPVLPGEVVAIRFKIGLTDDIQRLND